MGAFCGEGGSRGVQLRQMECGVDIRNFYDAIVYINSIMDIINGWPISLSKRFENEYENTIKNKVVKIGIIGNSNKGKSFILSKLSKINLPSGTTIKTEGLSIKYPVLDRFINRKIVLLDSAGLETPVLKTNIINQNNNPEKNGNEIFKEKSREKIITESFLQNYIFHNSDILIVVVGILTYSEQKLLNGIKIKLKRENLTNRANNTFLYVIHNLMTYTTVKQVEYYINETLLKSATFELEKQIIINTKTEGQNGAVYYEKNSNPKIFHLIFANEYSEAGRYYNDYTLSFIENSYEKITDLKGFDIIQTVKDRFKEVSTDIFEKLEEEIEYNDQRDLIKLKRPKNLKLKKLFLDELGISNLRANGFEPNYNYYRTRNHIIVRIEAPGRCKIESSTQFSGEYIIIKINGFKDNDRDETSDVANIMYDRREFGNFALDIPIKQEDFYFKNESPTIVKKNGIFILSYQIESIKPPVVY